MKWINLLVLILAFGNFAFAQTEEDEIPKGPIEVSKVVMDSFQKNYPGISNTEWDFGDGEYEVVFSKNGTDMTVDYDVYGHCTETETEIKISELPSVAVEYIQKSYGGFKLTSASRLVTDNYDVAFVVQIGKEGKFWDVTFDRNGKFLKEEEAN